MRLPTKSKKLSRKEHNDELFRRASHHHELGEMKEAFRLYFAAAKAGDASCQVNLANFYDDGIGVTRNRVAALYWHRRAYRSGDSCAAHNIGIVYRNEGNTRRALDWFRKAVALGDDGANLVVAKVLLKEGLKPTVVRKCLVKVVNSDRCSEADVKEARRLLKNLS
jgi:TPR repeat protein